MSSEDSEPDPEFAKLLAWLEDFCGSIPDDFRAWAIARRKVRLRELGRLAAGSADTPTR